MSYSDFRKPTFPRKKRLVVLDKQTNTILTIVNYDVESKDSTRHCIAKHRGFYPRYEKVLTVGEGGKSASYGYVYVNLARAELFLTNTPPPQ